MWTLYSFRKNKLVAYRNEKESRCSQISSAHIYSCSFIYSVCICCSIKTYYQERIEQAICMVYVSVEVVECRCDGARRGSSALGSEAVVVSLRNQNAPHADIAPQQIFLPIPYNASRFVLLIVFQFQTFQIDVFVSSISFKYTIRYCNLLPSNSSHVTTFLQFAAMSVEIIC